MRFRDAVLAGAMLLAGAVSAVAQTAGAVELGAFGRYSMFDTHLNFDNHFGAGARLGVFILKNLALEGDGSYTPTHSQGGELVQAIPLHGRLVYNLPLGGHSALLIGGGYTRQLFREHYRETNSGAGGLLGLRLGSFRLDATGDYIPTAESNTVPPQLAGVQQQKSNWHWGGQAGLSLIFGGKRDGDHDKDGVRDSADHCPNTPAGERVDATGCPLPKDTDGDGVTDNLDRCPSTPAGTAVDSTGCPRDSDGDGVIDAQDKCPNTAAGTPVDASGCPKDSDGDGVTDTQDKCPNTAAGTAVDATGCPADSDRDGVLNTMDKCPDTPAGTRVDGVGCPALFAEPTKPLVLQGVNFATGKATLLPESQDILDKVAESLNDNPGVNVEVGGHTDSRGARATNLRLSQTRAFSVREYLISKGVSAARITAKGYGPDQPVASNATAAGRAANRRVELTKTD